MNEARSKRVLLVDDEESARQIVAMLFEALGATVLTARNGDQALELYRSETFDLVLTDYKMPQMCGDELARAIKLLNPAQRVIMITGSVETILQQGVLPSFIDGLIPKPCTLNQLRDALNGTLRPELEAPHLARIAA